MKKIFSIFTLLFICFILFSCASGTAFVTGKKRPSVNPDRISIYTEPPEDYEVIGIVSAARDYPVKLDNDIKYGNVFVADSAQNVTGKAIYVLK
ncbi:MAG: hypothetical protein Q4P16_00685 [Spirochaetales bacterium]|nr:hypothetical protein [Spirochaetales bacterium]